MMNRFARTTGWTQARLLTRGPLIAFALITVVALIGYATFGRHPQWLQHTPRLASYYGVAFSFFAQVHIWGAGLVLFIYLIYQTRWRWLPALVGTYGLALTSELIGTTYGLPFGAYAYAGLLGPKWFGQVPWTIPLSWFLMALPAYALAHARFPASRQPFSRMGLGTLALVVWDLSLDPAMSDLTSYWTWDERGVYYGMPLINLAGWSLTGSALMVLLETLRVNRWIDRLSTRWCAVYYGVTLLMPFGMLVVAGVWGAVFATLGGVGLVTGILVYRPSASGKTGIRGAEGANGRTASALTSPGPAVSAEADGIQGLFEMHSRSFSFAARWFTPQQRHLVACLYAFCRTTDDMVDQPSTQPIDAVERRLEQWRTQAKRAYEGEATGVPWLDDIMTASARAGLPFELVEELVDGVRMDLGPVAFRSTEELDLYAYRVASVVGIWLCYLFGVRDSEVHERAAAMGRAMQTTNILRDVGEDLERDRIYLPADLMARYGVTHDDLYAMADGAAITPSYKTLIRRLMAKANADYEYALPGLRALPRSFARASAVAAAVYRGIHEAIRQNGFDNFRHRAYTGSLQKGMLAARGLYRLERLRGMENVFSE